MIPVLRTQDLPLCSRCGDDRLITSATTVKKDAAGQLIQLELCTRCDAAKPAAAALITFITTGGADDLSRCTNRGPLTIAWMKESMAAHGWHWA
ncbi:DUF6300 family protein [Streptomyces sp. NPDC095817]|uniref:DUF6300 family protein n=1 Tax=Streptomyces sp. NPDC095817 TaxID=3155082 RepID=UPI00331B1915